MMPRVSTQVRSTRGKPRICGRIGCGREIKAGESYYSWSFRYGGPHFRCAQHYPRMSELTQSKLSTLYAAIEEAEDVMGTADNVQDIIDAVEAVAAVANEVGDEYEEAAEVFGGEGENADRAQLVRDYADNLDSFAPEEVEEEVDCEDCEGTGQIGDGDDAKKCETCEGTGKLDNSEELSEAIETARSEAQELLNDQEF